MTITIPIPELVTIAKYAGMFILGAVVTFGFFIFALRDFSPFR